MEIRIERKGNKGEAPVLFIYKDGDKMNFDATLSRALTSTVGETGNGIFRIDGNDTKFWRGSDSSVTVQLGLFNFQDKSATEIRDEIIRRVRVVNRAFDEKYPAISEVAVFEI